MCGLAWSLPTLVIARILQGFGGGAMVPIAQAIMLESFPPQKRGAAMAVFAQGVVVAPILGPVIGGWITDSYSWRWIFYINLPVGIFAALMAKWVVEDPPYIQRNKKADIDFIGLGLLAVWLGTMQIVLDKGQEADWFGAEWVRWFTLISIAAFFAFICVGISRGASAGGFARFQKSEFHRRFDFDDFARGDSLRHDGATAAVSANIDGLSCAAIAATRWLRAASRRFSRP